MGPIRGVSTLVGVAGAGFLIWLSTQLDAQSTDGYWAAIGLVAAAGLSLVLSQVFGGWTKWGRPGLSPEVLLLAFLPALVVGGWVLLAAQPDANWFQRHIESWSGDLHVSRLVRHLQGQYLAMLAFGLGALLGLTVETSGPRARPEPVPAPLPEPHAPPLDEPALPPPPAPAEHETWVVPPTETATVVSTPVPSEDATRVSTSAAGDQVEGTEESAHSREG